MKYYVLAISLLLLAGCQTIHKLTNKQKVSIDSTAQVMQTDKSFTKSLEWTTDAPDTTITDVVIPDNAITATCKDDSCNNTDTATHAIVKTNTQVISTRKDKEGHTHVIVTIIPQKTSYKETKAAQKTSTNTNVQEKKNTVTVQKSKVVTGIPWYWYAIGGVIIILIIAFFVIKKYLTIHI